MVAELKGRAEEIRAATIWIFLKPKWQFKMLGQTSAEKFLPVQQMPYMPTFDFDNVGDNPHPWNRHLA